jgi:hypothetical protein
VPKEDGDFDLLLDGIADNYNTVITFLRTLAYLRDPQRTTILTDLEKEYGVLSNTALTTQERRDRLTAQKTDRISTGTDIFLQDKLRASGFDLYVYQNDPPVDPNLLAGNLYNAYFGDEVSYFGNPEFFFKKLEYFLIVNGQRALDDLLTPAVPAGYRHLVFFIGGAVSRDPITNEITELAAAEISENRRTELSKLVMKYKPIHAWAAAKILFS